MMLKRLTLILLAGVSGWCAGGWLLLPSKRSDKALDPSRQRESILGERQPHLRGRMSVRLAHVSHWAATVPLIRPENILTKVRNLPTTTLRDAATLILTQRGIEDDPLWALTALHVDFETRKKLVNGLSRKELIEALHREPWIELTLLGTLAYVDPGKALSVVQEVGLTMSEISSTIIAGFNQVHGIERAGEAALQFPTVSMREEATKAVLKLWVNEDIDAALDWAQALPEPALRSSGLRQWVHDAATVDPESTIALASKIVGVTSRGQLTAYAVSALASIEPEKAFAILGQDENMSDFGSLTHAGRVARTIAKQDPEQAISLFEKFSDERGYTHSDKYAQERNQIYLKAFSKWAELDIEAAKAQAEALIEPIRVTAMEGISQGE